MAAGWWFYDIFFKPDFVQKIFQLALPPGFPSHNKKAAATKIVDMFQNQVKLNGSDARIKMYGDIPYATPWWSWHLDNNNSAGQSSLPLIQRPPHLMPLLLGML
jgi:hypothetical protein